MSKLKEIFISISLCNSYASYITNCFSMNINGRPLGKGRFFFQIAMQNAKKIMQNAKNECD